MRSDGWFKKGYIPYMKGKKHRPESILKMKEAHKNTRPSPETEFKKGFIPWNKGLKGVMPISWNKGKKGIHLSIETEFKKGQVSWNKGKIWEEMKGERHPQWKGGISKDKKYRRKYMLIYYKKNRNKFKVYRINRRYMVKDLLLETIQQVYEDNIKKYSTLTCYLCLQPIPFGKDHLEHKTPLSRGGTNEYDNLAIACRSCKSKKHTKTEEEYRKENLCHVF